MQKKFKIEKRSYSLLKPFLYLILQIILIWEFFWILTGEADLVSWNYFELSLCAIMISYFFTKSMRIFKRTPKKNQWTDTIEADKFLHM